jgi:hypothetical protein
LWDHPAKLRICAAMLAGLLLPASAATQRMPRQAFKPAVRPPGHATVQKLGRQAGLSELRSHSAGVPLGGSRFVSVLSAIEAKGRPTFTLVVLDRASGAWLLAGTLRLPLSRPPWGQCDMAASVFGDDYDHDGKPEAMVRVRFCTDPQPAVGEDFVTDVFIVNLDGPPRLAFSAVLHTSYGASAVGKDRGVLVHEDLDRDGHPDLILRTTNEMEEGGRRNVERREDRYLWDPAADVYRKVTPK